MVIYSIHVYTLDSIVVTRLTEIKSFFLQVQTKLENPTRYHVMQKQKNQVRQYLSESFQQPANNSLLSHLYPRVYPQQTNSAPGLTNNYTNGTTGNVNGLYGHSNPTYNVGPSPSPSEAPPAMSPALSSGATSASEVRAFLYTYMICNILDDLCNRGYLR